MPPETQKKSIQINIKTPFEEITRVLEDRICLKIGRQVRGPQDKLASLAISESPVQNGQMSPSSPTQANEAETPNTGYNTPATVRGSAPPSPESSNEKLENLSIWFKSKVVSRSHAEIWFKDGHVSIINRCIYEIVEVLRVHF